MNSNQKFDVSLLNGKLVSYSESECLCFDSRCTNLSSEPRKERQYQLPVAILMSVTSTFMLLKVSNDIDEVTRENLIRGSGWLSIYPFLTVTVKNG